MSYRARAMSTRTSSGTSPLVSIDASAAQRSSSRRRTQSNSSTILVSSLKWDAEEGEKGVDCLKQARAVNRNCQCHTAESTEKLEQLPRCTCTETPLVGVGVIQKRSQSERPECGRALTDSAFHKLTASYR